MDQSGFIKLFRKFMEWEWYTNSIVKDIFIHILLKANHSSKKWQGIDIERGQFVTSRGQLATELKFSEQQIRTALNKLKSTNDITIKSTNKYTLITVVNYNIYQSKPTGTNQQDNQEPNQQSTNNQPTNNQQITTTNKLKNNKNEKNKKNKDIKDKGRALNLDELIVEFSSNDKVIETMQDFIKMRTTIKKPLTERALKNIINKLHKYNQSKTDDETINILNNSITNCWSDVYELKNKTKTKKVDSNTNNTALQILLDGGIEDDEW